jgi:hypothetical protein
MTNKQPWALEEYLQENVPMTELIPGAQVAPSVPPVPPEPKPAASNAELISRLESEKAALAQNFAKVSAEAEAASKRLSELESAAKAAEEARLKEKEDYKALWENEKLAKEAILKTAQDVSARQALVSELSKRHAVDPELVADALLATGKDKIQFSNGQILGVNELVNDLQAQKPNVFTPQPAPIPGVPNNPLVQPVATGNPGSMPAPDGSSSAFNARTATKEDLDRQWDAELAKIRSDGGRRSI